MRDYPREVNACFVSHHGDGKNFNNTERMNLLCGIAKTMVSGEHSSLIGELENKAKAEHTLEVDEWNMTLDDISLSLDVNR